MERRERVTSEGKRLAVFDRTTKSIQIKILVSNLRDLIRYLRKRKREEIIEFKYRFVGRVVRVLLPYRDRPIYRRYIYDG